VKDLLSNVGSGGGAPAAGNAPVAASGGGAAVTEEKVEEKKKEEEKEESDDDMVRLKLSYITAHNLSYLFRASDYLTKGIGQLMLYKLCTVINLMLQICTLDSTLKAPRQIVCTVLPNAGQRKVLEGCPSPQT